MNVDTTKPTQAITASRQSLGTVMVCCCTAHTNYTILNASCVLQEAFRKAAVAALTKRLQQSVGTATAIAGSELDSLFGVQAQLVQ